MACFDGIYFTGQFRTVIDNVAKCLEAQARSLEHDGNDHLIDSVSHHHWITPPGSSQVHPGIPRCHCSLLSRDQSDAEWRMIGEFDTAFVLNCCQELSEDSKFERKFDNAVLDSYPVKLNSLKTAFETANVILRISYLVGDTINK